MVTTLFTHLKYYIEWKIQSLLIEVVVWLPTSERQTGFPDAVTGYNLV